MTRKQAERQESIEQLRKWLKPGDTVSVILRKVSRSGMNRVITPVLMNGDEYPIYLGELAAKAIRTTTDGNHGVKMAGCGMDMGFALVHELSSVLFRDGFDCIGDKCPSNDHLNYAGLCKCGHRTNHCKPYCPSCEQYLCSDELGVHDNRVCICKRCRSFFELRCNYHDCHCNEYRKAPVPEHHIEGGYALKHRWL